MSTVFNKIIVFSSVLLIILLSFKVHKIFVLFCWFPLYLFNNDHLSPYEKSERKIIYNPITLLQILQQIFGQLFIYFFRGQNLENALTYENKIHYILPFKHEWEVVNGGVSIEDSHSWDIYAQRFAYDFIITDIENSSFKMTNAKIEDYYCFKKDIIASANGIVVKIFNKVMDYENVGDKSIDWKTRDFRGNFIIIKHCEGEYSFYAHLLKDSICVKKGDYVIQGQKIGSCGNSGHSTEPHLHFQLQSSSNFWFTIGLPIKFNNVRLSDKKNQNEVFFEEIYINRGQKVSTYYHN
jgi:Peptidase family M23